ncbi:hypothetical protein WG66_009667 [Moniliophthora roreri]|nr:hypothetical protein WG66_009667 [Moniliophthora roreri]
MLRERVCKLASFERYACREVLATAKAIRYGEKEGLRVKCVAQNYLPQLHRHQRVGKGLSSMLRHRCHLSWAFYSAEVCGENAQSLPEWVQPEKNIDMKLSFHRNLQDGDDPDGSYRLQDHPERRVNSEIANRDGF